MATQMTNMEGGATAGTSAPATTVVVVQTQEQATPTSTRQLRWGYGYFAIAVGLYHFFWTIVWSYANQADPEWATLFLLCGFLPSLITVIWIIVDSSVACCQPAAGETKNICGCGCFDKGKWIMVLPMGIATFLRIVLYIVLFGIVADLLNETESLVAIDNVFWIIVTYAAFDCGPMILITIDWWYYYVQKDFNGLFGTWANPMRCVVGQSGVLFVASWSFIAIFEQYADDAAEYIWPWILHGVVSTAVLIFCCIVQFSGIVTGNKLSTTCYRYVSWCMAAAMAIVVILILIFVIDLVASVSDSIPGWPVFVYFYYYTALSVPSVVAMASFKVQETRDMMQNQMGQQQQEAMPPTGLR